MSAPGEPATLWSEIARESMARVREKLAEMLARRLMLSDGFDQIIAIRDWSTSRNADLRHVLALALRWPFPSVAAEEAIEHLKRDPVDEVRIAAEEAARTRRDPDAPRLSTVPPREDHCLQPCSSI